MDVVLEAGLGALLAKPADTLSRNAALRPGPRARYGAAIALVAVALVVADISQPALPGGGVFLVLLIPVMIGAVGFGVGAGVVALSLGAAGSLLLVVLRGHPWLSDPADVSRLLLYLAEGGFILLLAAALRGPGRSGGRRLPAGPATSHSQLIEPLTEREKEVLRLAASGLSVAAIGRKLYLSRNTVKSHLAHAYAKLGAHNRAEAIAAGLHWGCIEPSALAPPSPHVGVTTGAAGAAVQGPR